MHIEESRVKLTYYLTMEEAQEAVQCVEWKKNKYRGIHIGIISLLGGILLLDYAKNPDKFYQLILLTLLVGVLFYLSYGVEYTRRRHAKQLVVNQRIYQMEINERDIICGVGGRKVPLKKTRAVYTDTVLVLWANQEWFVIPRRVLGKDKEQRLYTIIEKKEGSFLKISLN